ncbi:hypothetical protein OU800_22205 [Pseudomonas sp. GOM7]|uniref:HNH endonuclease n=1 Tax=Pseudomonas sp. GOM7 TaxID=2998079 RepID=UPI00227A8322|nr:HNH endonuclease [Pseudomonas sp. GOM7]WAJ37289.1 hypothetical protein OU800_22205 [Pseudomonas sp. GOM7]
MKRPRDCIICGKAAGSGEHVFPAALGGRRTSNGIYCGEHNQHFGPLVAYLQEDLLMMNACLEIRPDRQDSAKPFYFDSDGARYRLLGDNVFIAPPDPSDPSSVPPIGVPVDREFLSLSEAEEWGRQIERHGVKIKIVQKQESRRVYKVQPYKITLKFGGHEVLHAVAYLALSFFAQYFPREARQESLAEFKRLLVRPVSDEDVWAGEFVWWEGGGPVDIVRANPYRFGHTVIVGIQSGSNQASAYISFFSCLNFSVRLGYVEPLTEVRSVVVYIDPEAQTAAASCREQKGFELDGRVGERLMSLDMLIRGGKAEAAMGDFLRRVSDVRSEQLLNALREDLEVLKSVAYEERFNLCLEIVDRYSGYVLQQFRRLVKDAESYFASLGAQYDPIVNYLRCFVSDCPESSNGLSYETTAMLQASCQVLACEIYTRSGRGEISAENVIELIQGVDGLNLLKKEILARILSVVLRGVE